MNDAEIAQIVQGKLEQIKQALKQADENRQGHVALQAMEKILRGKFGILARYDKFLG